MSTCGSLAEAFAVHQVESSFCAYVVATPVAQGLQQLRQEERKVQASQAIWGVPVKIKG